MISRTLGGLNKPKWLHSLKVDHVIRYRTTQATKTDGERVLLITGGAGFLGQHIIRVLQQTQTTYSKIKVYDLVPYTNRLGYDEKIPVQSCLGDVTNPEHMSKAFRDVTSVIHIAALVSFGCFPDIEGMERVNIQGTTNVVKACVANSVESLTLCSSVDVVIGHTDIVEGTEETTQTPNRYLMKGYPCSKRRSEIIVLRANGSKLANGKTLNTVSLRANIMYGELDPYFVYNALKDAKRTNGILVGVGDGSAVTQVSYVGNVAWAFIIADDKLTKNAAKVGGKSFFVPDDTPNENIFTFLKPFLECRGFSLSRCFVPYSLAYVSFYFMELILWVSSPIIKLISPWFKINPKVTSSSIAYINKTFTFSKERADKMLGYKPIYSPKQSLDRSLTYYKQASL